MGAITVGVTVDVAVTVGVTVGFTVALGVGVVVGVVGVEFSYQMISRGHDFTVGYDYRCDYGKVGVYPLDLASAFGVDVGWCWFLIPDGM